MQQLKQCKVTIIGKSPLLMNRYPGELPSEAKPPRGKKTQAHIDDAHKRKWMRAAYWSEEHGCFHMPPENIDAMMASGAKKFRKGTDFKACVWTETLFIPLTNADGDRYAGKSLESFYAPQHVDLRGVVIQKARVEACRPRFADWRLDFVVSYDGETITKKDIEAALHRNCLGDYRPRFGQFEAKVVDF